MENIMCYSPHLCSRFPALVGWLPIGPMFGLATELPICQSIAQHLCVPQFVRRTMTKPILSRTLPWILMMAKGVSGSRAASECLCLSRAQALAILLQHRRYFSFHWGKKY